MIAVTTATPVMNSTDPNNAAPNSRVRTSNTFSDVVRGRGKRPSGGLHLGKTGQMQHGPDVRRGR
jgi:hypothetical protein